ncbi:VOC family protein [Streptacidiphilus sp. N1-3]|uniref:VOC family protein n=1 Tax=Streptacidiphilus alkalitolerans TaxID=3342712 RepID=A0ABV6X0F3_9ACTN
MSHVTAPYPPGTPCWVDLIAPDQRLAVDFYRRVLHWEAEVLPHGSGHRTVFRFKGRPVAGINTIRNQDGSIPELSPAAVWTTCLATKDVDAAAEAVSVDGGAVLVPGADRTGISRTALVRDPSGAVFGLWQADAEAALPGAAFVGEVGSFAWNELYTADPAAVAPFYSTVLGIEVTPVESAPGIYVFTVDGRPVAALSDSENLPRSAYPTWLTYFAVADLDAARTELGRAGGSVLGDTFDTPLGRAGVARDPQGAFFGLVQLP